jgi:hypothetical protein
MKVYATKVIAKILVLSERRVRQLRDEGIISEYRAGSGLYDLAPTVSAYIQYLRRESDAGEEINIHTERALLIRAKRRSEEYDLRLREGDLNEAADVERLYGYMLSNFRARLLSVPAKVAPRVKGKTDEVEVEAIIKAEIDEALQELSNFDTEGEFDEITDESVIYKDV